MVCQLSRTQILAISSLEFEAQLCCQIVGVVEKDLQWSANLAERAHPPTDPAESTEWHQKLNQNWEEICAQC